MKETKNSNSSSAIQVQVGAPLKLVAFVNGQQVSNGITFEAPPSDFLTNSYSSVEIVGGGTAQPKYIEILCWDDGAQDYVKGCQYQIQSLVLGGANGGHKHDRSNAPLYLTGTVKQPGLAQLSGDTYAFKCAGNPAIQGCEAGGYQHTDFYNVTPDVNGHMSKIGSDYSAAVPGDPRKLVVTDASLAWGGLYDFTNNWASPHTYHRQGTDIDIRRSMFNEKAFEKVVCKNGGFPYDEDDAHYHLFFYVYGYTDYIVTLCSNLGMGPQ